MPSQAFRTARAVVGTEGTTTAALIDVYRGPGLALRSGCRVAAVALRLPNSPTFRGHRHPAHEEAVQQQKRHVHCLSRRRLSQLSTPRTILSDHRRIFA